MRLALSQRFTHQAVHPIFLDEPYRPKKHDSRLRLLCSLVIIFVIAAMSYQVNAQINNLPDNEINEINEINERYENSGQLHFSQGSITQISALHLDTHIDAEINGIVALVTYSQSFKNSTTLYQEGTYTFPLPDEASINHMEIHLDDRVIIGAIKEKQEAKKIYEKAKHQGKQAALTQQHRPNVFTQKIANIAPGQTIKVVLRFVQAIQFEHGAFEWRMPTTLTPRHVPESRRDVSVSATMSEESKNNLSEDSSRINDAVQTDDSGWAKTHAFTARNHSNMFSLNLSLDSGLSLSNINALYHNITVDKQLGIYSVTLKESQDTMDRDFVLKWKLSPSSSPQAAFFAEQLEGDNYGLLMVIPPQNNAQQLAIKDNTSLPRDIIFIIDTSGSMQGSSITQAKESLRLALKRLGAEDRFNIIEFNSSHDTLFDDYEPVNSQTISYAHHWVTQLVAKGGTEMLPALNTAFAHSDDAQRLQQIVFITDGAVSNESALFNVIHSKLNNSRLFTVGIGSAPNTYFMRKAAEFGRGSFTFIGSSKDVAEKMAELFAKLEHAHSTNIQVEWNTQAEQYPKKIGDLYAGEPLVLPVKIQDLPSTIEITGSSRLGQWRRAVTPSPRGDSQYSGISSLWARSKVQAIEDDSVKNIKNASNVKDSVIDIALKHKILTRFTSFVAVEESVHRQPQEPLQRGRIPNALPSGMTPISYPQTATWAGLSGWLGALFLVGYMFVFVSRREP